MNDKEKLEALERAHRDGVLYTSSMAVEDVLELVEAGLADYNVTVGDTILWNQLVITHDGRQELVALRREQAAEAERQLQQQEQAADGAAAVDEAVERIDTYGFHGFDGFASGQDVQYQQEDEPEPEVKP